MITLYFYRFVPEVDTLVSVVDLKTMFCHKRFDYKESYEGFSKEVESIAINYLDSHYGEVLVKVEGVFKVYSNLTLFFNLFAEQGIQVKWYEEELCENLL